MDTRIYVRSRKFYLVVLMVILMLMAGPARMNTRVAAATEKDNVNQSEINRSNVNKNDNKLKSAPAFNSLPVRFEENRGQTDAQVKYLARAHGYNLFLTSSDVVMSLKRTVGKEKRIETLPLRMSFIGASKNTDVIGVDQLPGKIDYFKGNESSKWIKDIPTYASVRMQGLYEGVDLLFYNSDEQLEYDLIVAPGTDLSKIAMKFTGADKIKVNKAGDLVLAVAGEQLLLKAPLTYQIKNNIKSQIKSHYKLAKDGSVQFDVADYDRNSLLTIDPVIYYNRYLGGLGDDVAKDVKVLTLNTYVAGETTSIDFPRVIEQTGTPGQANSDIFLTELTDNGQVTKTTIFGSTQNDYCGELAYNIEVTNNNSVTYYFYVVGKTTGTDFPVLGNNFVHQGGTEGFLAVVSLGGHLFYSRYIGGSGDDSVNGIDVSQIDNAIYLTGNTTSKDLPSAQGLIHLPENLGEKGTDGFLLKLSSLATNAKIEYCSYLAANGLRVALDDQDIVYVFGYSLTWLPFEKVIAPLEKYQGLSENFLLKIDTTQTEIKALLAFTYIGGEDNEFPEGDIEIVEGNVSSQYILVAGTTSSKYLPSTHGYNGGASDGYIGLLQTEFSPNSSYGYNLVGGVGKDGFKGITGLYDVEQKYQYAFATGYTNSGDYPDTINDIYPGDTDQVLPFQAVTATLIAPLTFFGYNVYGFSKVIGGTTGDSVGNAIVTLNNGNSYEAIIVGSSAAQDFVTNNPSQIASPDDTYNGGMTDGFALRLALKGYILAVPKS